MNVITFLKKDVGANHYVIEKKIEEEVNSPLRENVKRHENKRNVFHNVF
jgi:hypothetical protein